MNVQIWSRNGNSCFGSGTFGYLGGSLPKAVRRKVSPPRNFAYSKRISLRFGVENVRNTGGIAAGALFGEAIFLVTNAHIERNAGILMLEALT